MKGETNVTPEGGHSCRGCAGPWGGAQGRECDVGWVLSFWGRAPALCQWGTAEC